MLHLSLSTFLLTFRVTLQRCTVRNKNTAFNAHV